MPKVGKSEVVSKLASALGRRDEAPNLALAEELAEKPNARAVEALVSLLTTGTLSEQGDAIKVLYELGERKPELIAPHVEAFLTLLSTKNNRLHWGLLSTLDTLGTLENKRLLKQLPLIVLSAQRASVIGKDKAVSLLCKLHATSGSKHTWAALVALLDAAPNNQFPSYAERIERVSKGKQRTELAKVITLRQPLIVQPAKVKRLNATLERLNAPLKRL